MSDIVEIARGNTGLIVSIPHTGTRIPPEIERDLVSPGLALKDTDWWIERLYDFSGEFNGHTIVARLNSTKTSSGITSIKAIIIPDSIPGVNVTRVYEVDSFFDVWPEVSLDGGPFIPGPMRTAKLTSPEAVIPEPSSVGFALFGLAGVAVLSTLRRRKANG